MNVIFDFNFWTVLQFGMNFALAVFVLMSNRKKAENDQLKAMEARLVKDIKDASTKHDQRIEKHSEQIARLESGLDNAIGNDDMIAVHKRVDEILALSSDLAGQMKVMNDNVNQMLKIMMNGRPHGG